MLRHKKNVHDQDVENISDDASVNESASDIFEENEDGSSEDDSMSDTDSESEDSSAWELIISDAFDKCQEQYDTLAQHLMAEGSMDEKAARKSAYKHMRSIYRKAVMDILTEKMLWYKSMQSDPVYKEIRKTVEKLRDTDDYDKFEAIQSAVKNREFLFDRVLKAFNPPALTIQQPTKSVQPQVPSFYKSMLTQPSSSWTTAGK